MILNVTDREGSHHRIATTSGRVLMEVLRDEGFGVEAVCGGCCACATCHVYLPLDVAGERGEVEHELLASSAYFDPAASRLSCQIVLQEHLEGVSVTVAPED